MKNALTFCSGSQLRFEPFGKRRKECGKAERAGASESTSGMFVVSRANKSLSPATFATLYVVLRGFTWPIGATSSEMTSDKIAYHPACT
jgi:hypothetical protein